MRRDFETGNTRSAAARREIGNPAGPDKFDHRSSALLYFRSLDFLQGAVRWLHATFFVAARLQGDGLVWGRTAFAPARVKGRVMARNSRGLSNGALALGGFVALGLVATAPQPAAAQGIFDALFGGFDRPAERGYRDGRLPPRSYAPSEQDRRYMQQRQDGGHSFPFFGGSRPEHAQPREARPAAPSHGGTVNCVRMCDGRYFPVPRGASGARLDPAKVCTALCPAAETKVFHGGDMQYARANDGTRYASLDTAFTFRERIVPDCSCTGKGPGGLAQIDIESDPTLRAGDIVVTAEGPTVFNGGQFPYQTSDFTPVGDYARLNRALREKLAEMQVNTEVAPVVPPQRIAVTAPERSSRQARQAAREQSAEERAERRRVRQQQRAHSEQRHQQQQRQRAAQQGFPFFRMW